MYKYLITTNMNEMATKKKITDMKYNVGLNNIDDNDIWTYDEIKLFKFEYNIFYRELYIHKIKYNFIYPKELFIEQQKEISDIYDLLVECDLEF